LTTLATVDAAQGNADATPAGLGIGGVFDELPLMARTMGAWFDFLVHG